MFIPPPTRRLEIPCVNSWNTTVESKAVCRFVEVTGDVAAIGALSDATLVLAGKAGTIVTPGGDYGAPNDLKPPVWGHQSSSGGSS